MSSSRLSIELFNFLLLVHSIIHLLSTHLVNTYWVPNTGLGAEDRKSRIRWLALGAYGLMRKEEGKSNDVPQAVEANELASLSSFSSGVSVGLLLQHELLGTF